MKAATRGSDLWSLAPPSLTHQGIGLGGKEPHLNKGLSLQQARSPATPEQQGRDRHKVWGETAPQHPANALLLPAAGNCRGKRPEWVREVNLRLKNKEQDFLFSSGLSRTLR